MNIERVGTTIDNLGEGLLWDEERRLLYWTDAMEGIVHRLDPANGAHSFVQIGKMIGAIALRRQGGAIASLEDGFYTLDLDTGAHQPVRIFDLGRSDIRFNDGKVDRQGRFLAGSMHIKAPADGISVGELHRLDSDGTTTLLETGIGNCNGPGFSPDGRIFYFADSPRRQIYAYDYDTATGSIANRRVFAETATFGSPPDGATVDAEGYLWSTMVMGGKIVRYAPSGAVDRVIDMPVRHPTNVTFGGPGLDVLYVTSISSSPNIAATEPLAGALFAVTGLGVTGLAEPRFAG